MTRPTDRLGRSGERLAADYLQACGYELIARNVRRREGEVDLVAVDAGVEGGALVFVEVKLRRPGQAGRAIEALSPAKQSRLRNLALAYAAEHPELPDQQRIDVVAIDLGDDGSVASFEHVVNAVEG
ncbi:MAG: YraN family protein [Chloroflexi bacterium]|nr:YraN family protein [Chloroflexota bacterium]